MKRWTVRDVMTTEVVTVGEATHYKEIVQKLAAHGVSAVPVVDADGRVVGVVSEADLIHKVEFAGEQAPLLERRWRRSGRAKATGEIAADLMSSPPIVVRPAVPLAGAAKIMDAEMVKRLPVVDGAGQLVGIVSRRDLLRVYLRDDDAIRDEILHEVLRRTLWIANDALTVTVHSGVVTLAGTVDRSSTIPLVVSLVEGVGGVTEVVDHLTYHYADGLKPNRHLFAAR